MGTTPVSARRTGIIVGVIGIAGAAFVVGF